MTSVLGNANCSMQITASDLQLQLDQLPVITLTNGENYIDCNGYRIANVGDAINDIDVLTKGFADSLYTAAGQSLSDLGAPTANVSWAGYKITNLGDATAATDALNRQTADGRYYLQTTTLDSITAPTADLNMNNHKIGSLVGPTLTGDAATKGYVDNNFYSQSTTLDGIAIPTASLDLNSQKITNLAAATSGTDALNRDTADARYILAVPSGDVDFGGKKLVNVAPGTDFGDVLTVQQDKILQQGLMYTGSNITAGISFPYVVPFASFYKPTAPAGCPDWILLDSDGVLIVAEAGTYKAELSLIVRYSGRTDLPVSAKIQRYDSSGNEIGAASINNVTLLTNRAPTLNTNVYTQATQLFTLQAGEFVKLVLTGSDSTLSQVSAGSSLLLQKLE